jgi:hypothetical protein
MEFTAKLCITTYGKFSDDCTNIEDLKAIFKNLLFVKHESIKMTENEKAIDPA